MSVITENERPRQGFPAKEDSFDMRYWADFVFSPDDLSRIKEDSPHLIAPREFGSPQLELWKIDMARRPGRYGNRDMIHRPNQLTHIQQTQDWVADTTRLLEDAGYIIDAEKAVREAGHHDDNEWLHGDFTTDEKALMGERARDELHGEEFRAIRTVALVNFGFDAPAVNGYMAEQEDIHNKSSLEAQVVNLMDKALPIGEQIHAHRVGNEGFLDMLPLRRQILDKLKAEYSWFADLAVGPLNWIRVPTDAELNEVPLVTIDDLSDVNSWKEVVLSGNLPEVYRRYLETTLNHPFPEVRLFGDWAPELWQRWGTGRTSLSIEEFALAA